MTRQHEGLVETRSCCSRGEPAMTCQHEGLVETAPVALGGACNDLST